MKKHFLKTTLSAMTMTAFLCSAVSAQSSDLTGFGDDFNSFDDNSFSSDSSSNVNVNGTASIDIRSYITDDDADSITTSAVPQAKLGFEYKGKISDSSVQLKFNDDILKNHPLDIVDELSLRTTFDWLTIEAGKMKVVWGKGDKLHVIDNFNADDYTDFIIPDYIDRRISTPMLKLGGDFGVNNLHAEVIYSPLLPVDRFSKNGIWTPAAYTTLSKTTEAAATTAVKNAFTAYNQALIAVSQAPTNAAALAQLEAAGTAYMTALTNANALSAEPDSIYPELNTLKYGQFGARVTASAGPVDFGISYYNGYYKQPSFNASRLASYVTKELSGTAEEGDKFLSYDKKQTFGLEAATTIWHFNLRAEAAYNLTEDTAGTDPWVHNNSISWLGGFDIDLPFCNMNVNIQETGSYILSNAECDKNPLDVDYCKTGYSSNKIVANVSASFVNDRLVPEVTLIYGIERGDVVVMPKLSYSISDGLTLSASGMYIWCKDSDSEFYAWKDNSFINFAAVYRF